MHPIDFVDFYRKFIIFTDHVLPSVPPVEHPILLCIFSHTEAIGKSTCQLSYADFHDLTRQSLPTIKKVLRNLLERGLIRLVNMASARIAKTYEFVWPEESRQYNKLQRDPNVILRTMFLGKDTENLIDKLDSDDRDVLNVIMSNLSKEEETYFRGLALSMARERGDPDKLFQEIVAREKFGKVRLMKYAMQNSESESGENDQSDH